jgi:CDP-diacylglycerol---glycerol-3-phosphate 3-phosphatidyltransferase
MLERLVGAAFRRVTVPIGRGLARSGLSANAVTILGFFATLAACYVVATGDHLAAGIFLAVGALFDSFDGAVARVTGTGSKRGAFLDSTLDRLADAAIFTALIWRGLRGPDSALWGLTIHPDAGLVAVEVSPTAVLALVAMVLGFMVPYVRARAEGLGIPCKVGLAERPERVALVAAGLMLDLLVPALAVLVVASAVTLVQRFVHVWQEAKRA